MSAYLVKKLRGDRKRIAFVSSKAVWCCPDMVDVRYNDGAEHTRGLSTGDRWDRVIEVTSTVLHADGDYQQVEKRTLSERGKASDKRPPVCRCGKTMVKRGYRFRLVDEDHRPGAILGGIMRDGTGDKDLEDRWFKTRKAAMKHLDSVYAKAGR